MDTPELDKMLAVKEQCQAISGFLDWLDEQQLVICEYDEDASLESPECEESLYHSIRKTKEQMLADCFGIDLKKCEEERRQILVDLKKQNGD